MPQASKPPSESESIEALEIAHEHVGRRLQALRAASRADAAHPGEAMDEDDQPPSRREMRDYFKDALGSAMTDLKASFSEMLRQHGKAATEAEEKGEAEDKDGEEESEEDAAERDPEAKELSADRRRRDSRNDSTEDRLSVAQLEMDRASECVFGRRAGQPMVHETEYRYRLRHLKTLQRFSDAYAKIALDKLPRDAFALADRQIRADAVKVGSDPNLMQQYSPAADNRLREVATTDQSGRRIIRFYGPVDAVDGLMQFCYPRMRARINVPGQSPYWS